MDPVAGVLSVEAEVLEVTVELPPERDCFATQSHKVVSSYGAVDIAV